MKKVIIILFVVVILAVIILLVRGNEDTWVCENNQWIKHGDPDAVQPTTTCGDFQPTDNSPKACTEEAKICPDGSAVGRTGPNCEFAQCP